MTRPNMTISMTQLGILVLAKENGLYFVKDTPLVRALIRKEMIDLIEANVADGTLMIRITNFGEAVMNRFPEYEIAEAKRRIDSQ